jgi:LysM repeat protein
VVQPGDSLSRIAVQFGTSVAALQRANGIADQNLIEPGQVLVIP